MKNIPILLFATFVFGGCSLLPSKEITSNSTTDSQSTSQTQDTSTTPDIPISGNISINVSGAFLPFENYGVMISDDSSGSKNRDSLLKKMNENAGVEIISGLSASNCSIQSDDTSREKEHLHLTIGTGSTGGYMEFSFAKEIKKFTIVVKAYYKIPYSIDSNSLISINDVEHSVTNTGVAEAQAPQTFQYVFSTPSNSIKISNFEAKQRFFVETIELEL